ncbi:helix-turn-helix domain-containing protein [Nitrospina watsonii]|uniref:helix-turn-helix domain-containing protein n=1 Tax=Nitrospina watsonii TaxID=1323948 RepID=UPI0024908ED2|nr:helix-turn-helix domain-containing protein [Nitrospina watsonii]
MTKSIEVTIFPDGRLDTTNASEYLGLSQKTLAMMRCQGNGPAFIKRGRIFYYKEDLDAWLQEGGKLSSTSQKRFPE